MGLTGFLEKVTAGFVRTRTETAKVPSAADRLDVAVAEIALMIAALDGCVRSEEFAAYQRIANRCQGLSDAERRRLLDDAVARAGRLLMMAQTGVYSESERLAVFGELVHGVLPNGFAGCSPIDVRRSFALWLSAAVADGEVSGIERQAVELLRKRLAADTVFAPGFLEAAERHLRDLADPLLCSEAERALDQLVIWR